MARSGLRSHFSGSVPISIAVHLVAVLLFIVIPLTMTLDLPEPVQAFYLPESILVVPAPPPPPAPVIREAAAPRIDQPSNPPIAPTEAPAAIVPERAAPGIPVVGPQTGEGVPQGIGIMTSDRPIVLTPPDPPRPAAPVRVADLPVSPRKIVDVRPQYPEIARAARVEGTIIMEAVLDTSGRVTQLRVLKSVPMLDQAAVDAVRLWRYTPSLYGGHPVSVLMTITVRFTLQ
jgi:protein TonB